MDRDPSDKPDSDNGPELKITFKGEVIPLDASNTVLRTFEQGNGVYDHCVVRLPDGSVRAIIPPADMKEALIKKGIRVVPEKIVDEVTIALFAAELNAQMDEGIDEST